MSDRVYRERKKRLSQYNQGEPDSDETKEKENNL
jgi:hypothetical protein